MTRARATSPVTVASRTRGVKRKAGEDGAAAANGGRSSTVRRSAKGTGGARGDERTPRYSDADLEPIRATLAAFRAGDFRPRPGHSDRGNTGRADKLMLAEIGLLADEVGSQLASLTSEVTDKAAQVRDIALITTVCVPKTSSTSGDQVVFVDQASDASPSSDAVLLKIDRFG